MLALLRAHLNLWLTKLTVNYDLVVNVCPSQGRDHASVVPS